MISFKSLLIDLLNQPFWAYSLCPLGGAILNQGRVIPSGNNIRTALSKPLLYYKRCHYDHRWDNNAKNNGLRPLYHKFNTNVQYNRVNSSIMITQRELSEVSQAL